MADRKGAAQCGGERCAPAGTIMSKAIRWIILIVLVAGPAVAVVLWWRAHYAGPVRTHRVEQGDILSGVTVSGTIRSKQKAAVAAEIIAAVRALHVREGQRVEKGQDLLTLDDSVVAAEVETAQARVVLAERQLAELVAPVRVLELEKAQKLVNRAKANRDYARKQFESIERALQRGAATQAELDLATNRLRSAEADYDWASAELKLLKAGARKEARDRAQAEVNLAKADVQRRQAMRAKYTLRAPYAGQVTARCVNLGEVISPGQVLLRVDNTETLEVRAQVQESQLSGVRIGGEARVLADAYPDRPLAAAVEQILSRVDPERGTITVLLKFAKLPEVRMMDGMAVDIALIGEEVKGMVRVPSEALETQNGQTVVWVREDGSFVRRAVTVGITDGRWTEVKSGVEAGETVRLP
jgi:HlyD family secretion protein